jgi:hypothetical protein
MDQRAWAVATRSDSSTASGVIMLYELLTAETTLGREQVRDAAYGEGPSADPAVDPPRPKHPAERLGARQRWPRISARRRHRGRPSWPRLDPRRAGLESS